MATPSVNSNTATNTPFKYNFFADYQPAVAWIVIATALVLGAQFGSTEKLAAAFAWLIFVAIMLANGQQAMENLSNIIGGTTGSTASGGGGGKLLQR